ncbi:AAA family ATPase [Streptomyces sp. NPDC002825]|uniref:AAA family ATPase n=1 Tax=Streptomyces sp. NPDC002825 TaxID=3154666 RepID=UPI00332CEA07
MVGREREQSVLSELVAAAGGQALVLRGDAGVGKSALLDHVDGLAAGEEHRVIRAAGVEAESELPFGGLHQFLYPLLSSIDRLDDGHRKVFDVVFGRGEGSPPSVMPLGIAVLELSSLVASQKPLLLVLDDGGQWFDTSSTEVCGFVGRRLTGSAVNLVVTLRSGLPSGFDTAALPELAVPTLSGAASGQLLDRHHPELDSRIRGLILEAAQGNPLALLELPSYARGNRTGHTPEALFGYAGIPLPQRLQQVYGTRIKALSDEVRAVLLHGALDGVGAGAATGPTGGARYRMTGAHEAVRPGGWAARRTSPVTPAC